jgi:excisionase family DNA binding protein
MTDFLDSALRSMLKSVMREVLAELLVEWKAPPPYQQPRPVADGLLLTQRETAERLAISERHLSRLTSTGQLPCVRVGKCVRYNVETVRKWLREAESTEQPATTTTHASNKQSSAALKLEATRTSSRDKRKQAEGQKQRRQDNEKTPAPEREPSKLPRRVSKGKPQPVQSEERISPFSVLLSELGIDRSSLPSITNGDLMRIAEVDIATMHGWQWLNKSLPEEALNKLKNHFRRLAKERQDGE